MTALAFVLAPVATWAIGCATGDVGTPQSWGILEDAGPDGNDATMPTGNPLDRACWAADDGSAGSNQTCVYGCCQPAYTAGALKWIDFQAACLCDGGPCTSECAGSGNYCTQPGMATASICRTCVLAYTGPNSECNKQALSECSKDPECSQYLTCFTGCP